MEENYCVLCQPTLKASNERIHIQQVMVILVREVHGKCMESGSGCGLLPCSSAYTTSKYSTSVSEVAMMDSY